MSLGEIMAHRNKMKLSVLAVLLLALTFVFGAASGAFMYATGKAVAETPKMSMVSHTEYRYGEPGQIISRLVDFQGSPVVVNNCTATIKYPDKTAFATSQLMTVSTITGDYYYNFTTPNGPEGVYEYQATCTYASGTKTASVTNSFHLSSAFTTIMNNMTTLTNGQSAILGNLTTVQNNLTALSSQLSAVNSSLSGEIAGVAGQVTALSADMAANFTYTNSLITSVNSSTQAGLSALNASTQASFTQINSALSGNFTEIQSNFSQVLAQLNNMNVSVNLTPVLDAIASVNSSMTTYFSDLNAALAGNFTYTNTLIESVNASTQSSFSVVNSKLDVMNTTLNANNAYLVLINTTTTNTYDYMTGTMATNINQILTDLGVINATVNRIETVTNVINATTTAILENQQNAVQMSVFSG